jgi:hypothetical protein
MVAENLLNETREMNNLLVRVSVSYIGVGYHQRLVAS